MLQELFQVLQSQPFFSFLGFVGNFTFALCLCTMAMFAKSFHNFGTVVNAMDIAPKHSGSVFGIVNAVSSLSGVYYKIWVQSNIDISYLYKYLVTALTNISLKISLFAD